MNRQPSGRAIANGETFLGIELGSTRVKAVLTDRFHQPLALGSYAWENRLENGLWTYDIKDIWAALRGCYADLADHVAKEYGVQITTVGAMGVSAMMHGYLAFDSNGKLLVPFRTWRNTNTGEAAGKLTELFHFNIPQRWSIAHLFQAILDKEEHVADIAFMTTLSGFIHWRLTGEKVLGIGDASGMFPINSRSLQFDASMAERFNDFVADKGFRWRVPGLFPKVLPAGTPAGRLTEEGARLLDPSGTLYAGIPLCPPEGDAGTGMAATNSVSPKTGNVSAGTSVFAMTVLERPLSDVYEEIDLVTTPSGEPAAMVHCNNCTGDLDAWVRLFEETLQTFGIRPDKDTLYGTLYSCALEGETDCGGLMAFNYLSGEPVTGLTKGSPMFLRKPDGRFTLPNFMRTHLYAALGALHIGMRILQEKEHVEIARMTGHGGFFKVPAVGQRIMSMALGAPVTVLETAGEGGPWGMALLAAYLVQKNEGETLAITAVLRRFFYSLIIYFPRFPYFPCFPLLFSPRQGRLHTA